MVKKLLFILFISFSLVSCDALKSWFSSVFGGGDESELTEEGDMEAEDGESGEENNDEDAGEQEGSDQQEGAKADEKKNLQQLKWRIALKK